jgi:hypothetical protein
LVLSLQATDSLGHPSGDVVPEIEKIPFVRHGDSLLVVIQKYSSGDGLLIGGQDSGQQEPVPFGALRGSNVQLTLSFGIAASTGFASSVKSRFLFTPAP